MTIDILIMIAFCVIGTYAAWVTIRYLDLKHIFDNEMGKIMDLQNEAMAYQKRAEKFINLCKQDLSEISDEDIDVDELYRHLDPDLIKDIEFTSEVTFNQVVDHED